MTVVTGASIAPPPRCPSSLRASRDTIIAATDRFAQVRTRLTDLGYGKPFCGPPLDRVRGSLRDQAESLARAAVQRVRDAGHEPTDPDLADILEEVFGLDLAVVHTPSWFDAAAWSDEWAKVIVVGTSPWPGRQRYAMAHSLCHLLADGERGLHVDADMESPAPERHDSEVRANAFADAFLMPEDTLRSAVACADWGQEAFAALSLRLGLPPCAAARRLQDLGMGDPQQLAAWKDLSGPEAAVIAGGTEAFATRCRAAETARPPARLVHDTWQASADGRALDPQG